VLLTRCGSRFSTVLNKKGSLNLTAKPHYPRFTKINKMDCWCLQCQPMQWQDDKASFGSSQFQSPCLNPSSPVDVPGLKARKKREAVQATDIGKSSSPCKKRARLLVLSPSSEIATVSSQEVKQPTSMFGKKILGLKERVLNLERNPFEEIALLTGTLSGNLRSLVTFAKFQLMFEWLVTGPYELLDQILAKLNQWKDVATSFGARLELVNLVEHGMKLAWKLTVRIREPNFGMVTNLNRMLLLTSFEEELTSLICSDGWTGIRSVWKLKEVQDL